MANRPVHWHEGMFLQPHHFQAADQYSRYVLRESEDWYHPFNWGVRLIDLDRDAIANYAMTLRSCEARFKDGTKVVVPADVAVDTAELKSALATTATVMVYLAVPALQAGRANVEERPTSDGPRHWVETVEREDENTGSGEQPLQFKRTRARLLLSNQDHTGYEVLPLCRIERSAQTESPPQVDLSFVPPLLALDAWPALWRAVQSLHHQIGAKIDLLAAQMVDRGISFDSQVPGDAERLLKLSVLNSAFSFFESIVFLRGLTPLVIYKELCRLVGQLAIFSEGRRPPSLPGYDHENIGGCFYAVIKYIQLGLDTLAPTSFEKRYFERVGERLQVTLEPGWLTATRSLFLGVETELSDVECQSLLSALDMKMGSGAQVEHVFKRALRGLTLIPIARPPRQLPASTGVVYYQVERDPVFWKDVCESYTLALRMNLTRAQFQGDRILAVVPPKGTKPTNLQFALFVI
jgi:type VI secretion system protein ImpJ